MAKSKTKSSRYTSSAGGFCTPAQYVAELMIIRQAKHDKVPLSDKFWNETKWKAKFKSQLFKANSLLKLFDEEVLVKVITNPRNDWVFSLHFPKLPDWLNAEQNKHNKLKKRASESNNIEGSTEYTKTKRFGAKSKLARLRELD